MSDEHIELGADTVSFRLHAPVAGPQLRRQGRRPQQLPCARSQTSQHGLRTNSALIWSRARPAERNAELYSTSEYGRALAAVSTTKIPAQPNRSARAA